MSAIHLTFIPPDEEDLVALHIEEAAASIGPYTEIDVVHNIGAYPGYIEEYTTLSAMGLADWFRIRWEDSRGALTTYSSPFKSGTTSLLGEIVKRVHERNGSLDIHVVQQETEVVLEGWFGNGTDPYDTTLTANYRTLNGLTYMVLARSMMAEFVTQQEVTSATLSLVSYKIGTSKTAFQNIDRLIAMAEKDLGIGGSLVLNMNRICKVYGGPSWLQLREALFHDQEFAFIPWQPLHIEHY